MSGIAEVKPVLQALAANLAPVHSVPIDKHINLFYTGLAIIFLSIVAYMFFSKKPQ
ncbi:MAG TPA: hypothetical protein VNY78_03260 [Edaphobacter sp.]|jgi:hypothetical protein|nr:hypothetical protein [Edaphobacter sp.]